MMLSLKSEGPGTGSFTLKDNQFSELFFVYPLKLIAPSRKIHPGVSALYLLSYGGGLVGGDSIRINGTIERGCSLVLLTQGSTKVFKSRPNQVTPTPNDSVETFQSFSIVVKGSLYLLPAPVTCFSRASYRQSQDFFLESNLSNLIVCDWLTSGRLSYRSDPNSDGRGENWSFDSYRSENQIFLNDIRLTKDALLLSSVTPEFDYPTRVDPYTCYASLFLYGPSTLNLRTCISDLFSQITQSAQSNPYTLIWSYTTLRGNGGLVRVAGTSTEQVKDLLKELLQRGGIIDLLGKELWGHAFT